MAESHQPELEYDGASATGPVRTDNQDTILLPESDAPGQPRLYAVADGMGGYAHGSIASSMAIETLVKTLSENGHAPELKTLRKGVEAANLSVFQAAQRLNAGRMGTTLTACLISGNKLYMAHVGDSRAYLIRDGQAACLTSDHTTVGDLVRMRVLSPDKVRTHTQRSVLTRGLGLNMFVTPDLNEVELREDDRLVLCSDGVWSLIQDDEFALLAGTARDVHSLSQKLIDLALERETDDNVSVVAIHIRSLAQVDQRSNGKVQRRFGLFWRSKI